MLERCVEGGGGEQWRVSMNLGAAWRSRAALNLCDWWCPAAGRRPCTRSPMTTVEA